MAENDTLIYHPNHHDIHTWKLGGKMGTLVSINMETGEHTFGKNYTPDDAARMFWEAVGRRVREESTYDSHHS